MNRFPGVLFDSTAGSLAHALAGAAMVCGAVHCPWPGSHISIHKGWVKTGPDKEETENECGRGKKWRGSSLS